MLPLATEARLLSLDLNVLIGDVEHFFATVDGKPLTGPNGRGIAHLGSFAAWHGTIFIIE